MAMRTIFLETAFWDYFSKCYGLLFADPYLAEDVPEKISRWNNLDKFIRRSSVFIDTPLYELAEKAKEDTRLRFLLKSNGDGNMELDYQEDPFPDLESNNKLEYESDCSSIYFTASDHQKAAKRHGVINICPDNIWNQHEKFIDSGPHTETSKRWNWDKLGILKENSNGMILIDNYIMSPPNKKTGLCSINPDLKGLLCHLLPDVSNEKYILSIFYYDSEMDDGWDDLEDKEYKKDNIETHRKQYAQSIKNFIKEEKRLLDFKVELFPTIASEIINKKTKDFHDRTIVTNNVWVGSEAGFDILDKKDYVLATKSTKFHGVYLGFGDEICRWLPGAYDQLISDAKRCLKKYGYKTENRILQ